MNINIKTILKKKKEKGRENKGLKMERYLKYCPPSAPLLITQGLILTIVPPSAQLLITART